MLSRLCAAAKIIIVIVLVLLFRPVPAYSQQTCVTLLTGYGRGPFTLVVPSWVNRIEGTVTWDGLQLRVFINRTVHGVATYGNPYFSTGFSSAGWGGTHTLEFGGISVNYVREWEVRGCGDSPPTPTPMPTPTLTPTRIPWPTYTVLVPVCESTDPVPVIGIGSEYVAIGSSVTIYPDEGATGDVETVYEVINVGQSFGVKYTGRMTFPIIDRVLIRVVGGSGLGVPMVWVEVTTCELAASLVPTPLAVPIEDIQDVVVGAEYVSTSCYAIMPSVNLTINIPFVDQISYYYEGFGVCLRKHAVSFRWGDWDLMAIIVPLLSFAFLWIIFYLFRRG